MFANFGTYYWTFLLQVDIDNDFGVEKVGVPGVVLSPNPFNQGNQGRFETEMLSTRSNLTALMDLSGE